MKRPDPGVWRFAWEQLGAHWVLLAVAIWWRVLFRLLPVQLPLFTGFMIDGLNGRAGAVVQWAMPSASPHQVVFAAGLALVALALASGIAAYCSGRASARLSGKATRELRGQVLEAWEYAPASFHREFPASVLFDRTLSETPGIGKFARDGIVEGVASGARLLYPAVMLFLIDPWMALLPLAALPLQICLTRFFQNRQGQFTDSIREGKSNLVRRVKENLDGLESVQSLGAQAGFIQRIQDDSEALENERGRSGTYSSMLTGAVWSLSALALAGSWWLGGSRVLSGEITTGQLVAFAGFVGYLAVPLRHFARLARDTRRALNGLRQVSELLVAARAAGRSNGRPLEKPVGGELTLHRVSFTMGDCEILRELSVSFPAGELIWLRGRSGAGKSTLLRLLAQFDYPTAGEIALNGQVLRDCDPNSVRRVIGFVPQHPTIFSGTIAENLRLGKVDASTEEMMAACRQAGLARTLREFTDGLETAVGEGGRRLSGGEAHRLAIARALLPGPSVLLLDEPTAALDPESEEQLLGSLEALCPLVTVIIVAHDLRSLRRVHRTLVLEGGELRAGCAMSTSEFQ